jgi:LysM repeat protein
MKKLIPGWFSTMILILFGLALGLLLPKFNLDNFLQDNPTPTPQVLQATLTPSETLLPRTPLASLTASATFLPPPTFEPPTSTPPPSATPTASPTQPIVLDVNIPGIQGLDSPGATTTPGCEKNKDWKLEYAVNTNETLSSIATIFNTSADALAKGNCLTDANLIRVGQRLRVPGSALPVTPQFVCDPIEGLQPWSGTLEIPKDGNVSFNWRGSVTTRAIIRIRYPSGKTADFPVELRQNETLDAYEDLKEAGWYEWFVLPMDNNFVQVCKEGGPFRFFKEEIAATETPTPTITPTFPSVP